jgi:phosphatidylglycerophosphate synthase
MIDGHIKSLSESAVDGESRIGQRAGFSLVTQIANALSLSRFGLAAAWTIAARTGERQALMPIAVIAIASDFLDGWVARRLRVESVAGRWLDAIADVMFILTAMACEVIASRLPIYVPILVAALFAQYAADSALRTGRPIASRIGHWCGIVNYAIVLLLSTGLASASTAVIRLSPILAAFYIIAMAERAWLYYEPRS